MFLQLNRLGRYQLSKVFNNFVATVHDRTVAKYDKLTHYQLESVNGYNCFNIRMLKQFSPMPLLGLVVARKDANKRTDIQEVHFTIFVAIGLGLVVAG